MLYNALLENNCSEQASRMSAMESSTKNATEMLAKLTLTYNRRAPHLCPLMGSASCPFFVSSLQRLLSCTATANLAWRH